MNTLIADSSSDNEEGTIILDIPSYGFHLLAWSEWEDPFTLSFNYEGEEIPSKIEIENYLYQYVKWYALSRWFERVAYWFGVPWFVTPSDNEDWSGDKIIKARWGQCPIHFIEILDEFSSLSEQLEWQDALLVYVWDLDIRWAFLPHIDQVIDVMREEKDFVFKSREKKEWVTIEKMLIETPMTFAVKPGWFKWVRIDASRIKWSISLKIMERIWESIQVKWAKWKLNPKKWWVKWTQWTTASIINTVLRL